MQINETLSYDEMESLDDMQRDELDRQLAKDDMQRVDDGGGFTVGWLFAQDGSRLEDPSFELEQPAHAS